MQLADLYACINTVSAFKGSNLISKATMVYTCIYVYVWYMPSFQALDGDSKLVTPLRLIWGNYASAHTHKHKYRKVI